MCKACKILIVEDEEPMLRALKAKFESETFSVIAARDGEKGLELAIKEKPDFIILDILMPKMNGLEMLQKMREIGSCKNIPVIILTNFTGLLESIDMNKLFVIEYLIKTDWKLCDLVKKVGRILHPQ